MEFFKNLETQELLEKYNLSKIKIDNEFLNHEEIKEKLLENNFLIKEIYKNSN
jgi:hypothetical protein